MMNTANKYLLILIIFFLTVSLGYAQNSLFDQYELALSLYEKKEYFDCITELKRLLFFDNEGKYNYKANFMIGECYKGGAKLNEAIRYFSISTIQIRNNEDFYNSKIEIVKCNILRRTTSSALQILDEMDRDERFFDKKKELVYWKAWAYMFNDDWRKASELFSEIDLNHPLKKLADDTANRKYSMLFAKVISYILPGSGQIYTGHLLPGLLSLGWNSVLVYFSLNSFYDERIFDGFITTGLFFRFYKGNIENTEKFVKEENLKIMNESLKYLQFEYKGQKP